MTNFIIRLDREPQAAVRQHAERGRPSDAAIDHHLQAGVEDGAVLAVAAFHELHLVLPGRKGEVAPVPGTSFRGRLAPGHLVGRHDVKIDFRVLQDTVSRDPLADDANRVGLGVVAAGEQYEHRDGQNCQRILQSSSVHVAQMHEKLVPLLSQPCTLASLGWLCQ